VFHVNDGHPISFAQIQRDIERVLGVRAPRRSVPYALARLLVRLAPGRASNSSWSASAAHRLFLISHDHWYDGTTLRRRLAVPDSGSLSDRLEAHRDWYQQFVAGSDDQRGTHQEISIERGSPTRKKRANK
jgi:hypothetical protein